MGFPFENLFGMRKYYYFCKECNGVSWNFYNMKEAKCPRCDKFVPRNKNDPYIDSDKSILQKAIEKEYWGAFANNMRLIGSRPEGCAGLPNAEWYRNFRR